jgi:hypothetical protein
VLLVVAVFALYPDELGLVSAYLITEGKCHYLSSYLTWTCTLFPFLLQEADLNRFCQEAQQIVAGTTVESGNIVWDDDPTGFFGSDAAPYEETGTEFPLTTQQFVSYNVYPGNGNKEYPIVISCKLKDHADVVRFIDENAGPGGTCKTVVEDTIQRVLDSLTYKESKDALAADIEFVVEDDNSASSGPEWTVPLPPVLVCLDNGSTEQEGVVLRVQPKALPVSEFFWPWPLEFPPAPPGIGPAKVGVHYCHLPAAEYLRELLTGNLQAPPCE